MTRRAYLALCGPGDVATAARAEEISARLDAEHWRLGISTRRIRVWTRDPDHPAVRRVADDWGVLIGRRQGCEDAGGSTDAEALARRLVLGGWGSYVALLHRPVAGAVSAFRDPGGALGCQSWSLGEGLDLVADDLGSAPPWLRPRRMALDWNRIAAVVAAPTAMTTPSLFDDMVTVGPGQLVRLGGGDDPIQVWSPATFARNDRPDLAALSAELVRRVDQAVAAVVGDHDRVVLELSGGLDSSILAGTLGVTGLTDRVVRWLNYRDGRPEADELRFARAVTDRLGVPLHCEAKVLAPLDQATLKEIGMFSRPAIGAVDATRDRFEADLLREARATGIVSGQGGDGVFFQFPTALVAADEFARRGWGAWRSPVLADVARRTRQSVWSVLGQVRAARRGRERRPMTTSGLLAPEWAAEARGFEHEWVRAARAAGLPPGKVLHVQGIALTHFYYEPSRRLAAADMLMPLFTQPVVEHCLSIPVPDLAGSSYDRPFARNAFAERLPEAVFRRRTKGALNAHVARRVAVSCETLRPYLLEGCLTEAGILDRGRLGHALDPERLMTGQAPHAMHVLNAAAVEAWVRHWQGRVPDSRTAGRA
jgi:asparagine synthase (glutamine-hydrolysing)